MSDTATGVGELAAAELAWNLFEQKRRAVLATYTERHKAAKTTDEDLAVRLACSLEYSEWLTEHAVPRPPARENYRPLAIVGREQNRPGPMSDG